MTTLIVPSLNNIMLTKIRIYEDEACTRHLNTRFSTYPVWDEVDDLFDGNDNWRCLLEEVEEDFPERWAAIIMLDDQGNGRTFYRRKHYLEERNAEIRWSFKQSLYLFDGDGLEAAERTFRGSLFHELNLDKLDNDNAHTIGRDEHSLPMISALLKLKQESYKNVVVVLNPSAQGITYLKYAESFPRMVWLKNRSDVELLTTLYQSKNVLRSLHDDMYPSIRKVWHYDLQSLEYLVECWGKLLDDEQAIWHQFEAEFC